MVAITLQLAARHDGEACLTYSLYATYHPLKRAFIMVFAFGIIYTCIYYFTLYAVLPIFVFFLAYTLALRERDTKLHIREIIEGIIKFRR